MQPVSGVLSCTHLTTALRSFRDDLIISSDIPGAGVNREWRLRSLGGETMCSKSSAVLCNPRLKASKSWEGQFAAFCQHLPLRVLDAPGSTLQRMRLRSKTRRSRQLVVHAWESLVRQQHPLV